MSKRATVYHQITIAVDIDLDKLAKELGRAPRISDIHHEASSRTDPTVVGRKYLEIQRYDTENGKLKPRKGIGSY